MDKSPEDTSRSLQRSGLPRFGMLVACSCILAAPSATWAEATAIDVTPQRIAMVPPGTVVGDRAPEQWSHLVLKTHPRVGAGDVKSISAKNGRLASLLSTVFLANVVETKTPVGTSFALGQVAVGCATKIDGQDIVISPDTQPKLAADFGLIERTILKEFYRSQSQVQVVLRSPRIALVDTPVVVRRDGENRPMAIRYALVVDDSAGNLNTLLWLLDDGKPQTMTWLRPNSVEESILHVDKSEYIFGIPSKRAFAITKPPSGKALPDVERKEWPLLCRPSYTAETATRAENLIRRMLTTNPDSVRTARTLRSR